jgi:hypothetical protein
MFMFIDASKQKQYETARLVSPVQSKTSGSCIHFYFNANGENVGSLNIYMKSGNKLGLPLLTLNQNSGDK